MSRVRRRAGPLGCDTGATLWRCAHEAPPPRDNGDAARPGGTRRAASRARPRSPRDGRARGPRRPREARARSGRASRRRGAPSPARRADSAARDPGRPSRRRRGPPCRLGAAVTTTLLLDNSAWVRLAHEALSPDRSVEIADAFEAGHIGMCLPFLLEAGYSARSAREPTMPSRSEPWTRSGSSPESGIIAALSSTCSSRRSPTVIDSASSIMTGLRHARRADRPIVREHVARPRRQPLTWRVRGVGGWRGCAVFAQSGR